MKWFVFLFFGFLCVFVLGLILVDKEIEVNVLPGGLSDLEEETIRRELATFVEGKFFLTMNLSELEERLESLPWIREASVERVEKIGESGSSRRVLEVRAQPENPVAVSENGELLSEFGEVIVVLDPVVQDFPKVAASVQQRPQALDMLRSAQRILGPFLGRVNELRLRADASASLLYEAELRLEIGAAEDTEDALGKVREFYREMRGKFEGIAVIDASYRNNGLAVRRRN